MSYFRAMDTVWYTLDSGEQVLLTNITKFTTFMKSWYDNPNTYLEYSIKDDERVDQLSFRMYDSVEYWWTILLFNSIYDIEEQWPRNQASLEDYISTKYPFNTPLDIHHYVNTDGSYADLTALKLEYGILDEGDLIDTLELIPISIYDFEFQINENKRNIKLVDPDMIGQVVTQYESLMA